MLWTVKNTWEKVNYPQKIYFFKNVQLFPQPYNNKNICVKLELSVLYFDFYLF